MLDLLASATALAVVVAVVLGALTALSVVPFVVALGMAEARRFSPTRWGTLTLLGVAAGLLLTYVLVRKTDVPLMVGVLPLLLTWSGPASLWLLEEGQAVGGRAGAHE